MKKSVFNILLLLTVFLVSCNQDRGPSDASQKESSATDPLPSWNDTQSKKSIMDFVTRTTTDGNDDFVAVADRIACFDNDGTLWSERPFYFQLTFAMDRIKALAPQHPEWKTKQPFKAFLEGDVKTALSGSGHSILDILLETHAGMTTDEFSAIVKEWINTARHPKTNKLYKEMVFQPMLELLDYLRANGYKTYIVSGGGLDFMRPWTEEVYGIPAGQVVGSSGKIKYEVIDGKPVLVKLPEINFINDKEGKPVGIYQYIGKRPIFTAGNSDGDYAMLQWTSTGTGPCFGMIVHHTDSIREYAYDRESPIGSLNKGLDDAPKYNWVIVDMKEDWKRVYRQ